MLINSVLQKYPEMKRPEALFEISNISKSTETREGDCLVTNKKIFDMVSKIPVNPPFHNTWYEYIFAEIDKILIREGVLCEFNKQENNNFLRITTIIFDNTPAQKKKNEPFCLGYLEIPLRNDFTLNLEKNTTYRGTVNLKETYDNNNFIDKNLTSFDQFTKDELQFFAEKVFYANALLNCKNVSTDSHEFQNRRSIQHYKRIGKPYFEKYYTLKLEVPGSKKLGETKDGVGSDGYTRAFHICRGHFKIYTEVNPLFGKYTGTYWWNSQVRGDINVGVIDKDYKLSNKKEMVSV